MKHQIAMLITLVFFSFLSRSVTGQAPPAQPNVPSLQLPVVGGQLDTNIFNTNGLVVPEDVQLLIQDLQVNMNQLAPLLATLKGENPNNSLNAPSSSNPPPESAVPGQSAQNLGQSFGQNLRQHFGTLPGAAPTPPPGSNGVALIYAVGTVLEDMQADLQELLPRLASMAGQTNYFNSAATMRRSGAQPGSANGNPNASPAMPASKRPL